MKKKILLGRGALFACGSAISTLLAMCAAIDCHFFARAKERFDGVIVVHRSAGEWFSSIRWSAAG
jgi:hypothetical protein